MAPVVGAKADDIQLIRLHDQSFFIPKSWMARHNINAVRATDGGGTKGSWSEPQADPIEATDLIFVGPDQNAAIVRDWTDPLPSLIVFLSYRDTPVYRSSIDPETKKWLDIAASQSADTDGFVRVWKGFAEPGQQPQSEKFLYKGYLNKLGHPLVVFSDNLKTPFENKGSRVDIAVERDLSLIYKFSNKKFPENTWWDLYKNTLAFLTYLQKPK